MAPDVTAKDPYTGRKWHKIKGYKDGVAVALCGATVHAYDGWDRDTGGYDFNAGFWPVDCKTCARIIDRMEATP